MVFFFFFNQKKTNPPKCIHGEKHLWPQPIGVTWSVARVLELQVVPGRSWCPGPAPGIPECKGPGEELCRHRDLIETQRRTPSDTKWTRKIPRSVWTAVSAAPANCISPVLSAACCPRPRLRAQVTAGTPLLPWGRIR